MITGYEVRYRIQSDLTTDWTVMTFSTATLIELPIVRRDVTYDIEIRAIDSSGRMSEPSIHSVVMNPAPREGALALPVNSIANITSVWDVDTSVEFSATSDLATVTVSAGTLVIGGKSISYGASSASIAVTPSQQTTVYMYYDDPQLRGGTLPLGLTKSYIESVAGNGRVAINFITFTPPAPGDPPVTGGGGIGGGGGGGGAHNPAEEVIA